jgi:hypothetical protein
MVREVRTAPAHCQREAEPRRAADSIGAIGGRTPRPPPAPTTPRLLVAGLAPRDQPYAKLSIYKTVAVFT